MKQYWSNMKKMNSFKLLFAGGIFLAAAVPVLAQDAEPKELLSAIAYHVPANGVPYLLVTTTSKLEKRLLPVPRVNFNVFMDADSIIISKGITDAEGKAIVYLPGFIRQAWDASASHTFILHTEAMKGFDETQSELAITKAKLLLDTVAGAEARTLRVRVLKLEGNEWLPAGDVELKLGVKRFGGELLAGEEETLTTDSTGYATAEFARAQLPGDQAGDIILVARIEDNEQFGNLVTEHKLAWGVAPRPSQAGNERSLWATRDKAPVWLIAAAIFIVVIVWGTIVFLVMQLIQIRRLGT
jgi:hypothetical protein